MSREDVIRQIVARDTRNQGLSEEIVAGTAPELHAAACEYYGTWDTALRYAGISERRLSVACIAMSASVLRVIRQMCLTGYNLSAGRNKERDPKLYYAAVRYFGSWRRALRAAGINLAQARPSCRPSNLSRDKIIRFIQHRHALGLPLKWHVVCFENRVLALAAKNLFCSWRRAMEAAGVIPENAATGSRRKWDRQTVLDAIRRRQQEGKTLKCVCVRKEHGGLVAAARCYFRTWDEAVAAAGIGEPLPGPPSTTDA